MPKRLARNKVVIFLAGTVLTTCLLVVPLEFLDSSARFFGHPGDVVAQAYEVGSPTPVPTEDTLPTPTVTSIPTSTPTPTAAPDSSSPTTDDPAPPPTATATPASTQAPTSEVEPTSIVIPTSEGVVTTWPLPIQFTDQGSAGQVQFWAYYDGEWHDLGTDTDGSDGWSTEWDWSGLWNWSGISYQDVQLTTWLWDADGNLTMDPGGVVDVTIQSPSRVVVPTSEGGAATSPLPIQFTGQNDVGQVQFWAYYDGEWHDLGMDIDGTDGWSTVWDWSEVGDQPVQLTTWTWDADGNLTMDPGGVTEINLPTS